MKMSEINQKNMLEKELILGKDLLEKAVKSIDEWLLKWLTFYSKLDKEVIWMINCFYAVIAHICDGKDY